MKIVRNLETLEKKYPEKFQPLDKVFCHIRKGERIFLGTGCGEPQYLVHALIEYVNTHPKAFFDTELFHVWTLGVAPYTDEKFKRNFRHNSFFIGNNTREPINRGQADYTPVFLSQVPSLFRRKLVPIDVALIQTSLPDDKGYLSLGVSVDITKAAAENASLVIAQINSHMPRLHGDTFIHIEDIDFLIPYDKPLLEFAEKEADDISQRIGKHVSHIIEDGDTIQVGYGSIPNAILKNLKNKQHLGVHSELLTPGMVDLMKDGIIDNSHKSIDRGKTVASFCLGNMETYDYIHDNPGIEFRTIDYTNNPLVISKLDNMVAINSALQIDLTGQATAESIGRKFYSGIGGSADFMRGAVLSPNGKTILVIPSTTQNGDISRIVPFIDNGAGVTMGRGDLHYVVTEYGIAYIHGKNIRERAMDLIAIAHPKFRSWLIEKAKEQNLIYRDQMFVPGEHGEYPEELEIYRKTKKGLKILIRPTKISDEPLLKDFFYSLSDKSIYRRFFTMRQDMPHKFLQEFVAVDYSSKMVLLAVIESEEKEEVIGVGQYIVVDKTKMGDLALAVRDDYQNQGIGTELLSYLVQLGKKKGLPGFTADVLGENRPMLALFKKLDYSLEKRIEAGVFEIKLFLDKSQQSDDINSH
ncbi:GNAT family N-acetyltransferase [Acidobacteriota bacterium]